MIVRFALALAVVLATSSCAPAAPPRLREEIAKSPPGTATIVFLTDFQCPFCRRTHAALEAAMHERPGKVRLALVHVPLRSHPDARTAAKAAICAEAQGIDLAHDLATSPDLSATACEGLATKAGANAEIYRTCVSAASTEERLERDDAFYQSVGGDGVPILFVGETRFDGQQSTATLIAAIDRGVRGGTPVGRALK